MVQLNVAHGQCVCSICTLVYFVVAVAVAISLMVASFSPSPSSFIGLVGSTGRSLVRLLARAMHTWMCVLTRSMHVVLKEKWNLSSNIVCCCLLLLCRLDCVLWYIICLFERQSILIHGQWFVDGANKTSRLFHFWGSCKSKPCVTFLPLLFVINLIKLVESFSSKSHLFLIICWIVSKRFILMCAFLFISLHLFTGLWYWCWHSCPSQQRFIKFKSGRTKRKSIVDTHTHIWTQHDAKRHSNNSQKSNENLKIFKQTHCRSVFAYRTLKPSPIHATWNFVSVFVTVMQAQWIHVLRICAYACVLYMSITHELKSK